MADLTQKQARFVEEYSTSFNATQAAIRAGYSEKTAYSQGQRLLKNVEVQQALIRRREEIRDPDSMTVEEAMVELSRLARADMGDYAIWGPDGVKLKASTDLPEGATAAVVEVSETFTSSGRTVRFKLSDKRGALDSIVKVRQWEMEQAKQQAFEERIEALEKRIEELGATHHSNGAKAGGNLLQQR